MKYTRLDVLSKIKGDDRYKVRIKMSEDGIFLHAAINLVQDGKIPPSAMTSYSRIFLKLPLLLSEEKIYVMEWANTKT